MITQFHYAGGLNILRHIIDYLDDGKNVQCNFIIPNISEMNYIDEIKNFYMNASVQELFDSDLAFSWIIRLTKAKNVITKLQEIYGNQRILDLHVADYRRVETNNKDIFQAVIETVEYKEIEKITNYHMIKMSTKKDNNDFSRLYHYVVNMSDDIEEMVYNCGNSFSFGENSMDYSKSLKMDFEEYYKRNINLPFFNVEKITIPNPLPSKELVLKYKNDVQFLEILSNCYFCSKTYANVGCGSCNGCKFKNSLKIDKLLHFHKVGLPIDKLVDSIGV